MVFVQLATTQLSVDTNYVSVKIFLRIWSNPAQEDINQVDPTYMLEAEILPDQEN